MRKSLLVAIAGLASTGTTLQIQTELGTELQLETGVALELASALELE